MVQCNSTILRQDKYNFYVNICEFQSHMSNVANLMNARGVLGQAGLGWYSMFVYIFAVLSSRSCFISYLIHNFSYVWLV